MLWRITQNSTKQYKASHNAVQSNTRQYNTIHINARAGAGAGRVWWADGGVAVRPLDAAHAVAPGLPGHQQPGRALQAAVHATAGAGAMVAAIHIP